MGGVCGRYNPLKHMTSAYKAGGLSEAEEIVLDLVFLGGAGIVLYGMAQQAGLA